MLIMVQLKTPIGVLNVSHDGQHVHSARFCDATPLECSTNQALQELPAFSPKEPPLKKASKTILLEQQIANELALYFQNPCHCFQLPLKPQGTPYQQRIWNALLAISSGRTVSYGELASTLQSSARAIGQACKKNPLVIFIPCHRVLAKTSYGGYLGRENALHYKLSLLEHEKGRLQSSERQILTNAPKGV